MACMATLFVTKSLGPASCPGLNSSSNLLYRALQPPFNEAARAAAGFGPQWYLPLSVEVLR